MLDLNERHLGWIIAKIILYSDWGRGGRDRQKFILAVSILNRCRGSTVKILTFHNWSTHLNWWIILEKLKLVRQEFHLRNLISKSWILGCLLIHNESCLSVWWVDTCNVFDVALLDQMLGCLLWNWRCIICGRGSWLNEVRTCNLIVTSRALHWRISEKGYGNWHQLIWIQDLLRLLLNVGADKERFKRFLIIEGLWDWLLISINHLETLLVDIRLGLV